MENLPLYIPVVFIATTILTLFFFHKAARNKKAVLYCSLFWLGLQAAIGLSGFYLATDVMQPRFGLMIIPPFLFIGLCLLTKKGKEFINSLDAKWLTLLHVVRIPVEIVLFWLFTEKYIPELMTFEGRNFDVLSGLSAPLVYYFGYVQKKADRKILLLWNFVCLGLLLNIVVNAMLSAPFPFQQFAFDQPNVGVLYFPFVWLPCFIVPVVLLSHLVSIRIILKNKEEAYGPSIDLASY